MSKWLFLRVLRVIAMIFAISPFTAIAQSTGFVSADNKGASAFALQDLNFNRTASGGAQVSFVFDKEGVDYEIAKIASGIKITFFDSELGEEQYFKMDVVDFATPIEFIETFQQENTASVLLASDGELTVNDTPKGVTLGVTIEKVEVQTEEEKVAKQYDGTPISLDFQDVPVRQVLQVIAQINGFNLVTTDTVTGNVTVNLNDVPWDQALSMILKIKGLDKRTEGNILLVAPAEELASRETQRLQSDQQKAELAPLMSETVQINYAKAAEMAGILKSDGGGLLSNRGTVTVDNRTNSLLIRDTAESIQQAKVTIRELDIPIKQVLIESRMVTVRDNVDEKLGVRWGYSERGDDGGVSGSIEGADSISAGLVPDVGQRLNVNLPVASAAGRIGFQIAKLSDGTILDLELSALETENQGEIIASPRITVANQHEAYIEQGTEIPYVQATSSGATSVEYKKAVLSLKVTPHITPDNRIILDLVVTQDTRGDTVQTSTGPAVAIDTQEISTQVLVENGETIVLGGIFQQNKTKSVSKVPLFGDLPVLGHLFKTTGDLDEKRELLIFVTPKIVTDAF